MYLYNWSVPIVHNKYTSVLLLLCRSGRCSPYRDTYRDLCEVIQIVSRNSVSFWPSFIVNLKSSICRIILIRPYILKHRRQLRKKGNWRCDYRNNRISPILLWYINIIYNAVIIRAKVGKCINFKTVHNIIKCTFRCCIYKNVSVSLLLFHIEIWNNNHVTSHR